MKKIKGHTLQILSQLLSSNKKNILIDFPKPILPQAFSYMYEETHIFIIGRVISHFIAVHKKHLTSKFHLMVSHTNKIT